MEGKTCCVTGHRKIPIEKIQYVKERLTEEIADAIEDGYTNFISGFASGSDLYFAEIVKSYIDRGLKLNLEAAIPYRKRYGALMKNTDSNKLLLACSNIKVLSENYSINSFMERNLYMIENSERVIAVYDGRNKGGTFNTIKAAERMNKQVLKIMI